MSLEVSVIIPTYNRVSVLKRAVDSVLRQSFQHLELIIIDDGSTDETPGYLETLKANPNVKIFRTENKGVSCARNFGVQLAKAKWLAFLDSDDEWLPGKLKTQWEYVSQDPQIKIIQTDEVWIRHGVRVNPMKKHQKYSGWIFGHCVPLCIISPSAVMIHQEVFERCGVFDEGLPACEDYDLWLRVTLEYEVVTLFDKLIVKYGGHDDQLSRQPLLDKFRIIALKKILNHPKLSPSQRQLVEESIGFREEIIRKGAAKRE